MTTTQTPTYILWFGIQFDDAWARFAETTPEQCPYLDLRDELMTKLEEAGFKWWDATGGQAGFADGDEARFIALVQEFATQYGVTIAAKRCEDPGLGLF